MIRPETVKVSHAAFGEFLRGQDNPHWDLDGGESVGSSVSSPCTVEEILNFIQEMSAGDDVVYVLSERGDEGAYGAAKRTDWSNVPRVDMDDLRHYVVTTVDGADFLYFTCSAEAGSSGNYITLLP